MADRRDIDRWKKGKDHWNEWAEGWLKAKEKLEKAGKWEVDDEGKGTNEETKHWISSASVDFSKYVFEEVANFHGFLFPHAANFSYVVFEKAAEFGSANFSEDAWFGWATFSRAWFGRATFHGAARFGGATFSRDAGFSGTTFSGVAQYGGATFSQDAWFGRAIFSGHASFRRAIFSRDAWFNNANFSMNAIFNGATFSRSAVFRRATFSGASFQAAVSGGPFSLARATFREVPNFIQMSFREPVRLDDIHVPQARAFKREGDKELAARYRALKKIAIEAHDHVREQLFFGSEAKERRGNDDPKWSLVWIVGFPYELLSDFGQSIAAPFWWWISTTFAFWLLYLGLRDPSAQANCSGALPIEALYLSLKNALVVIGWERSQKLNQVYACLFGGTAEAPVIPTAVSFLQMGQTLWSAILVFLFLLAVRNHFKIR